MGSREASWLNSKTPPWPPQEVPFSFFSLCSVKLPESRGTGRGGQSPPAAPAALRVGQRQKERLCFLVFSTPSTEGKGARRRPVDVRGPFLPSRSSSRNQAQLTQNPGTACSLSYLRAAPDVPDTGDRGDGAHARSVGRASAGESPGKHLQLCLQTCVRGQAGAP